MQTTVKIIKATDGQLDVLPMTDVARTSFNVGGAPLLVLVLFGVRFPAGPTSAISRV